MLSGNPFDKITKKWCLRVPPPSRDSRRPAIPCYAVVRKHYWMMKNNENKIPGIRRHDAFSTTASVLIQLSLWQTLASLQNNHKYILKRAGKEFSLSWELPHPGKILMTEVFIIMLISTGVLLLRKKSSLKNICNGTNTKRNVFDPVNSLSEVHQTAQQVCTSRIGPFIEIN